MLAEPRWFSSLIVVRTGPQTVSHPGQRWRQVSLRGTWPPGRPEEAAMLELLFDERLLGLEDPGPADADALCSAVDRLGVERLDEPPDDLHRMQARRRDVKGVTPADLGELIESRPVKVLDRIRVAHPLAELVPCSLGSRQQAEAVDPSAVCRCSLPARCGICSRVPSGP